VSRYSVLHVREDDGWRMASVREWVPDPTELVTLQDVAWSIGDKKTTVFEAGLNNLTQEQTTLLVHYGKERTRQMILQEQK
jgi:hypothetical protein